MTHTRSRMTLRITFCLAILCVPSTALADLVCPSSSSTLEIIGLTTSNVNKVWLGRLTVLSTSYLVVLEKQSGSNDCDTRFVKYQGTSTSLTGLTKNSYLCLGGSSDELNIATSAPSSPYCTNKDLSSWAPWNYNGYTMYSVLDTGNDVVHAFVGGSDVIYGGPGDDSIDIAGSGNTAFGESNDDTLDGHGANTVLQGGYGNDLLRNFSTNGSLYGYFGDDDLYFNDGASGDPYILDGGGNYDGCCPYDTDFMQFCETFGIHC